MEKKAIIIGAGPAGLTAAYELLKRTDIKPVILEKSGDIGGISKTVNYKGNRIDIGGHRFFSKSDRVMNWWMNIMPVQQTDDIYTTITYQRNHRTIKQEESHSRDNGINETKSMLIRRRLSRIYFLRKFFTYPIQLSIDTLQKLGLVRTLGILLSYTKAQLFPRKPEKSLEDFLINRFGVKLYLLFFKDYTEKVWGVPCNEISAEWGAQRIKGVSISKAIQHAAKMVFQKKKGNDISQKGTETSLIEQFLYPALGPGQLWEEVARQVIEMGGEIIMHQNVKEIQVEGDKVAGVFTQNSITHETSEYKGDYFFSTMPVQELIAGMNGQVPADVQEIAAGLQYRDFITIGVLLKKLTPIDNQRMLPDTWIYIQERDVKVGRLQIFNNWSPYMVKDPDTVWVGMEYFCNTTDAFWNLPDAEIRRIGISELEKMGLAKVDDVLDSTVLRMEKTYPAYFGTYNQFDRIKEYTDQFENLFLVGRNGMHKYNNSDHSMLTAMVSVDNICAGVTSKVNIWAINTEQDYHEEKSSSQKMSTEHTMHEHENLRSVNGADPGISFREYILRNKISLYVAAVILASMFAIFKCIYPFPSFIYDDSFVYLETAYKNLAINTYPIGYSKFLRLLSVFSSSDLVLIAVQYVLLQVSILSFLLTIFYFYRPHKYIQRGLIGFMLINPIFLFLSNYVSSDCLFVSLSLWWFTLLLWILYRPGKTLLVAHCLVLFLAFIVRYNALYYPLISALVFMLSKQRTLTKIWAMSFSILLIGAFVIYTSNKYYELTGTKQFSPFTGWQIANNAMYAYHYIDSAEAKVVPSKFRMLDSTVRTAVNQWRNQENNGKMELPSTHYMWDQRSPFQRFMYYTYSKDTSASSLKRWATLAPYYADYGYILMRQYPAQFIKYYILPNTLRYFTPPIEFLSSYNDDQDTVKLIAKNWFNYKVTKLDDHAWKSKIAERVVYNYPVMIGSINIVFLCSILGFRSLKKIYKTSLLWKGAVLISAFWLINLCFSVYASPIALRFQMFPFILFFSFTVLLIEKIANMAQGTIGNIQEGVSEKAILLS